MSASTTPRVTADDLELAATWLEGYDGIDDNGDVDETTKTMHRVAVWLRREAAKREDEARERAQVRDIIATVKAETGRTVTPAQARKALREARRPEAQS